MSRDARSENNSDMDDLITQLSSGDAQVRLNAAFHIGSRGVTSTVPLLLHMLDEGRPEARHGALVALRVLYSQANARQDAALRVALEAPEVVQAMAQCLRDCSQEAAIAASIALQFIGTPAAHSALEVWRRECGIPQ